LDWEEAQDPNPEDDVHYDLCVSTSSYFDPDSTTTIEGISTSEYVLDEFEYSVLYYWKVRAYDQWSSTWSDQIWSFDVENFGDASGDGIVDVADVVYLVNYLFADGSAPDPLASGDENGDCLVDVADIVYLVNYLFLSGASPQQGCA
jgi:prepilin-type processing-associated H-X9-DG protein